MHDERTIAAGAICIVGGTLIAIGISLNDKLEEIRAELSNQREEKKTGRCETAAPLSAEAPRASALLPARQAVNGHPEEPWLDMPARRNR